MENLSLNLIPLVVVLFIVEVLVFHVLNRVGGIQKLLTRYQSFIESQLKISGDFKVEGAKKGQEYEYSSQISCSSDIKRDDKAISREDIETVMEKLSLFCTQKDEKLMESLGPDEISNLFEDKEPCLEELKGAFDVFDENKDGFIDVEELHRVLNILGLKEGFEMEYCRMMIHAFDENRDNKIDFHEFVKVMEYKL